MYEFVGKSSPFLVLAFLALLDGGEKPNGLILSKNPMRKDLNADVSERVSDMFTQPEWDHHHWLF